MANQDVRVSRGSAIADHEYHAVCSTAHSTALSYGDIHAVMWNTKVTVVHRVAEPRGHTSRHRPCEVLFRLFHHSLCRVLAGLAVDNTELNKRALGLATRLLI